MQNSPKKPMKNSEASSLCSIPVKRISNWPFMYYQDTDGSMKKNVAEKKSDYDNASDVGEALL
jgi:hypothetical protein